MKKPKPSKRAFKAKNTIVKKRTKTQQTTVKTEFAKGTEKPTSMQRAKVSKQTTANKRAKAQEQAIITKQDDGTFNFNRPALIACAEVYRIGNALYQIEDYKLPGDHHKKTDPHRRFRVIWNGCEIGQYDGIKEARQRIFDYLMDDMVRTFDYAFYRFKENVGILDDLSNKEGEPEIEKLKKFLIKEDAKAT